MATETHEQKFADIKTRLLAILPISSEKKSALSAAIAAKFRELFPDEYPR